MACGCCTEGTRWRERYRRFGQHKLQAVQQQRTADGTKSARWYDAPVSLASLARIKFAVLNHTQVCAPLQLSAKVLPVMLVALEESCVHGGEGYL